FRRFLVNPVTSDPQCRAKAAIVRALLRTAQHEVDVYRVGVEHIQREPVWGGSVDTAAELRAQSGLGLVRAGARDATLALATLLADPEAAARTGAAQA